ncbi:hypothetical protein KZZ07_19060 [Mameliella sp. CS4]|uniref:SecDF P1 head subdomain-containing protein n=1 Tax=Mameliella sp. CS4 TaxID=2862329 RepID=UPI001C5F4C03|nr:hypothetical protein [Mameliella sp. CS4]MBW4984644.1 hypothetical protein [Mameliella sp. CS4]
MHSRRTMLSLVSAFVFAAATPALAACNGNDAGRIALASGDRTETVALADASPSFTQSGQPTINLALCADSAPVLASMTKEAVGQQIALTLDGEPVWNAVVAQPILGGALQVTGGFTADEVQDLATRLRAAAGLVD